MKNLIFATILVLLFTSFVYPATETVTFMWDAPTTNADGTALVDLAGFRIYCGASSNNYDSTPLIDTNNTTASYDFSDGTYFCNVKAYDASGNESMFDGEVSFIVDTVAPSACSNFRIQK